MRITSDSAPVISQNKDVLRLSVVYVAQSLAFSDNDYPSVSPWPGTEERQQALRVYLLVYLATTNATHPPPYVVHYQPAWLSESSMLSPAPC